MKFRAIHFFCGSGGLALGFKQAGFDGVGLDYDPRACDDYRRLTGEPAYCVNIATLSIAELLAIYPECPDVAASSSPCVGLSGCLSEELSKTEKYQAFNALTLRGVELMVETWKHSSTSKRKQPGLIVFENVPRITSRGKVFLDRIVALLQREGYSVNMSSHCCGEIAEGLAEKRPRFLLVARHMATVPEYLRKPAKNKPLALREVLSELTPPRPDTVGMHRLPDLSDLNKLRLAAIPAGGDWRDLPSEVLLYHCDSADLEAVTGIRWKETAGRMTGKLGVLSWEAPARTVIGNSRVCQTWAAVADPRVGWATGKDRPHGYGVADDRKPSATIRGKQVLVNSRAAVVDPRLGCLGPNAHSGVLGVEDDAVPAHTITGSARIQGTRASVSDPRLATVDPRVRPASTMHRSGDYGVLAPGEPSATIRGRQDVWTSPGSMVDPRLAVATSVSDHDAKRQNGGFGVNDHAAPSGTVVAEGSVQNTRAALVDPRLSCRPRATAYGVADDAEGLGTVVGAHAHDNSVGSVVDPRLGHEPRNDSYGVQSAAAPSSVVRGEHSARQAPGAVDDPRLGKRKRKAKPAKDHGIAYDTRGWPIPTHELVKLGDGRLVLYGPPRDFTRKRPVPGMVIRSYDGTLHRPLTTRELARIQGFPNDFEFCGPASCGDDLPDGTPQTGQRKRIGNAVPPPAGYAIGKRCWATLEAVALGTMILSGEDFWVLPDEQVAAT